jgi:hypothetical protein
LLLLGLKQPTIPQLVVGLQRLFQHSFARLPAQQVAQNSGSLECLAECRHGVAPVRRQPQPLQLVIVKWPSWTSKLTVRAAASRTAATGSALTGTAPIHKRIL